MYSKISMYIMLMAFFAILGSSSIKAQNIGINETGVNPNASAMLDVVADDKGILIPRVNIIDLSTDAPITSPETSLLVYNTNATSGVGYYFWDGSKWVKIKDVNSNADHDWYEVGGTDDPDAITDDLFTLGNVGIGTEIPNVKLHVLDSTNSVGTAGATILELQNYVGNDLTEQKSFLDFSLVDDNTNFTPQVRIGAEVGENASANSATVEGSGAFVIYTAQGTSSTAGNLTEKMRVDYQGFVGMGTTTPENPLHVKTTTQATVLRLQRASVQNVAMMFENDDDSIYLGLDLNEDFAISPGQNLAVNPYFLIDHAGGTGNVGIGTGTPDTKLHVYRASGDTKITIEADPTNTDEHDNPTLELVQDGELIKGSIGLLHSAGVGFLGTPIVGRTSVNSLVLNTAASNATSVNGKIDFATLDSVRMSINGIGGQIGIGTSSPNPITKLDVEGYMIGQNFLFHAHSTNEVTNFTNGVVAFTEVSDPHNDYAVDTYTVPVDGYYFFSANISFDGGDGADDTMFMNFTINGTANNPQTINPRYSSTADGLEVTYSHSAVLSLTAGETVSFSISNVNSSIVDYQYRSFMGYMISK